MNYTGSECGERQLVRITNATRSRDAQSTEKSVFYGFLSLVSVYGQFFLFMAESTDFFLLGLATTPPPPHLHYRDRGILRTN